MKKTFWGRVFDPRKEMFIGRADAELQNLVMDILTLNFLKDFPGFEKELFQIAKGNKDTMFWQVTPSRMWSQTFRLYLQEITLLPGEITTILSHIGEETFNSFIRRLISIKSRALLLPVLYENEKLMSLPYVKSLDYIWSYIPLNVQKGIPLYPSIVSSLIVWRLFIALISSPTEENIIEDVYVYDDTSFVEDIGNFFYLKRIEGDRISSIALFLNSHSLQRQELLDVLYSLKAKLDSKVARLLPFRKGRIASTFLSDLLTSVYYREEIKRLFELTEKTYMLKEIERKNSRKKANKVKGFLYHLSNMQPELYEVYKQGKQSIINSLKEMIQRHTIEELKKKVIENEGISPDHPYFSKANKSVYYTWEITKRVYEAYKKGKLDDIIMTIEEDSIFLLPLLLSIGNFELIKKRRHPNTKEIIDVIDGVLK
jgi:hypothetical protein